MSRVFWSAIVLAAMFALSVAGLRPPAPAPSNAPATKFSAVRAAAALGRILGDDAPHPVGSLANAAVRDRILAELTGVGYQPVVQSAFACNEFGVCAMVNNVLARLEGAEPGQAILLAAHYDSVPAGPGDSDDGTGVAAVLEIARAMKSLPAPRHAVIFLLDDGEEAGLLGARAFVDGHPWALEVRAAVNLEARGTAGPSLMFETGSANDWAVRLYARHATRPAASSIFYTLYKQLPNDTDFTVFKAAGYQGVNFAYVGHEPQYHTPIDNSAHVNLGSLQHHGENALPMVVALANSDLDAAPGTEAVFFDVFGRGVIHWQARRTLGFAILAALLLAAQIGWMMRTRRLAPLQFFWGLLAFPVTLVAIGLVALVLRRVLGMAGATPVNWVAHPLPLEMAFWCLAVATGVFHAVMLTRRAGFWGLWSGVWAWWALLSLLIAWQMPGLSYIVLVPAGAAALAGWPASVRQRDSTTTSGLAAILPLGAAGLVGFAPALLLYDGLGNRALVPLAVFVGLLLTAAAPVCSDLRETLGLRLAFLWIPVVATVLAAFAAAVMPAYSAQAPERVNIEYVQESDSGKSQWIVQPESGHLPEPLGLAAAFRPADQGPFPSVEKRRNWDAPTGYAAEAPAVNLAPPTFTILESTQAGATRTYRVLLRSERGATYAAVEFPPNVEIAGIRMEGQPMEPETPQVRQLFNGWRVYACATMPASGVELTFSLPVGTAVRVSVADQSLGLPPEGAFLLHARPLAAAASQSGDVTIVSRRVEFNP